MNIQNHLDRDKLTTGYCLLYRGGELITDQILPGSGEIWLDNLMCEGQEESITECQHDAWGQHNCQHHEDAVIRCDYTPTGRICVLFHCLTIVYSIPTNAGYML